MKLLAIETSGNLCGAAILNNENLMDKIELENGLTHSESLMPLIEKLLVQNSLKLSDFDAFICDIGPGSFTGIRIGVATTKAFVDSSFSAKFTGVPSLEALAYNVTTSGLICSVIDCKNDNCYFSLYNLESNNYTELLSPKASSITEMLETLRDFRNSSITFVGDGAISYKDEILQNIKNAQFLETNLNKINTLNLAIAGLERISLGKELPLSPMYLKKPQAQRQLEEKEGIKNEN